jgi:hypothetical protein
MKLDQLKKQLNALPDDAKVFMASDEEGNSYTDDISVSFNKNKDVVILTPQGAVFQPEDPDYSEVLNQTFYEFQAK